MAITREMIASIFLGFFLISCGSTAKNELRGVSTLEPLLESETSGDESDYEEAAELGIGQTWTDFSPNTHDCTCPYTGKNVKLIGCKTSLPLRCVSDAHPTSQPILAYQIDMCKLLNRYDFCSRSFKVPTTTPSVQTATSSSIAQKSISTVARQQKQTIATASLSVQPRNSEKNDFCKEIVLGGQSIANNFESKSSCVARCEKADLSKHNTRCMWGSEIIKQHPFGGCLIKNASGNILEDTYDRNKLSCESICNNKFNNEKERTCTWGKDVLYSPEERKHFCQIKTWSGDSLFLKVIKRTECTLECNDGKKYNHQKNNTSCRWGDEWLVSHSARK